MKKIIFTSILLLVSILSQSAITTTTFTMPNYGTYNVVIYTPDNTTGNLPAVIFIPGNGESNSNVNGLYVHGPLKFIRDNGYRPNHIVIGIQPLAGPAPYQWTLHAITTLLNNPQYRIDPNKWYLTGLSYGASAIFFYVTNTPANLYIAPKAIAPMSITVGTQCGDFYQNTDYLCGTDLRYATIPAWGFSGGWSDSHHEKMARFFQRLIEAGYDARFTIYNAGHCCWNNVYNPAYREVINGVSMNVYEWMMRYPLPVVLPVTFSYFRYNNLLAQLEWETSTEVNASHFEIEESVNGSDWSTIGSVPAKGNGGNGFTYNFKLK